MTTPERTPEYLILLIEGLTSAAARKGTEGLEGAHLLHLAAADLVDALAAREREAGTSWAAIGHATMRTRQAAQQRWGSARTETPTQAETLDLEQPATEQPATEQPKVHTIVRAPGERGGPNGIVGSSDRWWLYCGTCGAIPKTMRTREEARAGRRTHLRDMHGQEVER